MKILVTKLFALDIGTRSVVGIVLEEQGDSFHIVDLVAKEHKERSMIDGQIHNILSVAAIIQEIKEELELSHGPLKRVSVAAAGRSLKTAEGKISIDISERTLISGEDINRLELSAVQNAQETLLSIHDAEEEDQYYCVGYSVLHYKLNDEKIGSLIDQKGRTATVEVIATFLPRVVVESLLAALKRANLEMEALTLEPIAAINVLVPPSMRRLNIALVDIGAGTSDIAIVSENTVTAYGMVPVAGDEMTETLSTHYLLDFPLAEQMKREINDGGMLTVHDILGFEQQIQATEVIEVIRPSVKHLAASIANEIKRLNHGNAPQAVMIVGGGGLTPTLTSEVSVQLGLPENRVAIRSLDALSGVTLSDHIVASPALVTPIGIAIAAKRAPIHYISLTVNGHSVRLFELKELTVGDALLAARISARQLYGKPGLALTIKVNGTWRTLPGEHGSSTTILLNGTEAGTKDAITDHDSIELIFGKDGRDATATVRDLIPETAPIQYRFNGMQHTLSTEILLNGSRTTPDAHVADRDELRVIGARQVQDIAAARSESPAPSFSVIWNGTPQFMKSREAVFWANGRQVPSDYLIQEGDRIETVRPEMPSVAEIAKELDIVTEERADVLFDGEPVTIRKQRIATIVNNEQETLDYIVKPGDKVEFRPLPQSPIIFSDLFSFTDFSLPSDPVATYRLLRNGEAIGFTDAIFGGDELTIVFE